ncbi:hypothetical protein [Metapseudomonas otitidis]|uniref:hypothetical protein n=1 Tax=Metapseudomonas otitidis TaxID=319939 RepID=UPI003CF8BE02
MPVLSLTDLVDLVSKAGTPKATKVKEIKNRDVYQPATDYYKRFRDALIDIHFRGRDKDSLQDILSTLPPHKIENYAEVVEGYRKWWGRKELVWFDPPRNFYNYNDFSISVNPELGLFINGEPHLIKLYLKSDPLSKLRVDVVGSVMGLTLAQSGEVRFGVLDVRNSKLFVPSTTLGTHLIDAELAYVEALWPHV